MVRASLMLVGKPILEVKSLKTYYPITSGLLRRVTGYVKAVDDISFSVPEGKTLGLVGESGCGKTTVGHSIMRGIQPTGGSVIFHDKERGPLDVVTADTRTLHRIRRNMQMVFQDPYSSLNPRMTLQELIGEPLEVNGVARGRMLKQRVAELLRLVGLSTHYMNRFPHAFSG